MDFLEATGTKLSGQRHLCWGRDNLAALNRLLGCQLVCLSRAAAAHGDQQPGGKQPCEKDPHKSTSLSC